MLNNWTLCILTLPSRDIYLRKLLGSFKKDRDEGLSTKILYNSPLDQTSKKLADKLSKDYPSIETRFYNSQHYGISEGRNYFLNSVKTPLIAFLDDDCSFGGINAFQNLEKTLQDTSLALVGLPSYTRDSEKLFKPREECPKCDIEGIFYMDIEGMFAVGYTQLMKDIKGFNERKKFRVEWADLNARLHRFGYSTGVDMNAGFLRHWDDAPQSATRDKGRHKDFLYALIVTTIEFNCINNPNVKRMWDVAEEILLKKGYKDSIKELLKDTIEVVPEISKNINEIEEYRVFLRNLPFQFMPFEPISREDWLKLIKSSEEKIQKYKSMLN